MRSNEFSYNWITSKFSVVIEEGGKKTSFNAHYRAKNDSVMWVSISPALGIEVARVKITKDSVKFMNRINSTYFEGDFNYISNTFGVDVDFDMLQSILTGNAFSSYKEEEFKSFIDKDHYLLSTMRKRKLRKSLQKNDSLDLMVQSIWLEPRSFKISKFGIYDFKTNNNLEVFYSNFTPVESQLFPFNIFFQLTGEKPAKISIQYSKVANDIPQSLPFTIPEKYELMH
ncbi:MAG: DUF4292 domain-containing protein [Bacteroidetes bacterium]|nr:DUF4292 domain-containing protein [Bacteroidota bacterium]HET6245393.1 DUF4292 domain-containing protein [Bacteroidia bacterium]